MPKKGKLLIVTMVLVLSVTSGYAFDFSPGMYRITSTAEIPGMPAMPAQQVEQCLTKQQPISNEAMGAGCTIDTMKSSGNTLSWTMTCRQQGATSTGTGTMVYQKDRFSGTFVTTVAGSGGGAMTVKSAISGIRIGPCP